jgi:glycine/D-amino acid oxidase-like deaminating enzyme
MKGVDSGLGAIAESEQFDVVVVGAGGAGMAAALFAAIDGRKVLLIERTEFVGGTTAYSAGTTWVPGTHHAAAVNPHDTLADAVRYLDNAVGGRTAAALRRAFLDHGAQAVAHIEANSEVRYRPCPKHPDYISDLGGATINGRALEPLPFDGRLLGALFKLVRPPIPEFTVLGGMMVDRNDINHRRAPCARPPVPCARHTPGDGQCVGRPAAVFAGAVRRRDAGAEHRSRRHRARRERHRVRRVAARR